MQIPHKKHLVAAATLIGRSEKEASLFLERLRARPIPFTFWGDAEKSDLLTTEGAGSIATFMISPPEKNNSKLLLQTIQAARLSLAQKGIATAHAILGEFDLLSLQLLLKAEFTKLAILQYMEMDVRQGPCSSSNEEIAFHAALSRTDDVLSKTLQKTFIGSLDCPAIHGKRNINHILESHQGYDPNDLSLWFTILYQGEPAGVLLLNQPEHSQHLDLAYLGIIPKMRKKGIAKEAIAHAVSHAIKRGCNKINLAVDSNNAHAIHLYKKANFQETARRIAMFCPLQ